MPDKGLCIRFICLYASSSKICNEFRWPSKVRGGMHNPERMSLALTLKRMTGMYSMLLFNHISALLKYSLEKFANIIFP